MENVMCPICGAETKQRAGKFGTFFGCVRYPECKGIVKGEKQAQQTQSIPKNESNAQQTKQPTYYKDELMVRMSIFRGLCDLASPNTDLELGEKEEFVISRKDKWEKWIISGHMNE